MLSSQSASHGYCSTLDRGSSATHDTEMIGWTLLASSHRTVVFWLQIPLEMLAQPVSVECRRKYKQERDTQGIA